MTQQQIDALLNSHKVISDHQVMHRADTKGVVVVRVLVDEMDGRRFEHKFWADWESGTAVKTTVREIKA